MLPAREAEDLRMQPELPLLVFPPQSLGRLALPGEGSEAVEAGILSGTALLAGDRPASGSPGDFSRTVLPSGKERLR
jgi:hypothetical protein